MNRIARADLEAAAALRATGYLADVLAVARVDGDFIELSPEDFARLQQKYAGPQRPENWPLFARLLARGQVPADRGVGDTIARVIGPVGGEAFKTWFTRLFGRPCGCAERQEDLNRHYPYVDEAPPMNGRRD